MSETVLQLGIRAKKAKMAYSVIRDPKKEQALSILAGKLKEDAAEIIKENKLDIETARDAGIKEHLIDRLMLDCARINEMARSVLEIAAQEDPVGKLLEVIDRPNGLHIEKVSVPMGVIGMIYEARPNVTVDCAALCIKTGNCAILKGGKEAANTNAVLERLIRESLGEAGLPEDMIQLLKDNSREATGELMTLNGYVDVLIPRGGSSLIQAVVKNATVPVIETGAGICHIYVEQSADLKMALDILVNAKVSRPSVCNSAEVLLVDEAVASVFLPLLPAAMPGVEFRCDAGSLEILLDAGVPAAATDFDTEFNDYILAVKIVPDVSSAVAHIETHGTHHSDAIITENREAADYFFAGVDSAAVYLNASTRFTDGGVFGFGAEIGISTQKLHARGPMGARELLSYKYIVTGDGQVRR